MDRWQTVLLRPGWPVLIHTSPLVRDQAASEKALYVLSGSNLLSFNMRGKATIIGSGFSVGPSSGTGFVFGPDNALYVSEYNEKSDSEDISGARTVTQQSRTVE
ncbi:hypothetical protein ACFS07_36765 [Undibacterium arcticum]